MSTPFTLGVASGAPTPDSVVLWTRLAPDPLRGGGMGSVGDQTVDIIFSEFQDFSFSTTLKATAEAKYAHSVHRVVTGLQPNKHYWYRFSYGGYLSPVGRTKTAGDREKLNFAFLNCQKFEEGLYPVYRDIAEDNSLDLVIHLGDYIYENTPHRGEVRATTTKIPTDLATFRNRHAEYDSDRDLQAARGAHPWIVTWDDHEVENDYAGTYSWYVGSTEFRAKRAAAYQAYYEHMPLHPSFVGPTWESPNLYGRTSYGQLAQLLTMDIRQYRTKQPCGDSLGDCSERYNENNSMLGSTQLDYLKGHLNATGPKWNILANSIFMTEFDHDPGYYVDGWDGYPHSRKRLFEHLYNNNVSNPIVLSGDIHAAWVANLKYHPTDPINSFKRDDSLNIAVELIGPSVTSRLSDSWNTTYRNALYKNPHIKYYDNRNGGYVKCVVTPDVLHAQFRWADNIHNRLAPVKTVKTFAIANQPDVNKRIGATAVDNLVDVKLVEPEPDHRVVGWRWATGYGKGKENYWLLPRQLRLPDGRTVEVEQLKRG